MSQVVQSDSAEPGFTSDAPESLCHGIGSDWLPDGSKIAFWGNTRCDGNSEIYVIDADGSNRTRLTENTEHDSSPSWSHDGSKIAFHTDRDSNLEVYVMNADGSNPTNLTNNVSGDAYPSWSPDDSQIAFDSMRDQFWREDS